MAFTPVGLDVLHRDWLDSPGMVDQDFAINFIPRGYEMLVDTPISLPLDAASMNAFHEKTGYYYAPIDDGLHVWNYRIDDATLRQQLLSNDNYMETASYGLNSHAGLGTIRQFMDVSENDELVSFADVYAAIKSNQGYISQFADKETVDRINRILQEGVIMYIQVEGLATSQDNYSADVDGRVGKERNTALAENRAQTVISWLTEHPYRKGSQHPWPECQAEPLREGPNPLFDEVEPDAVQVLSGAGRGVVGFAGSLAAAFGDCPAGQTENVRWAGLVPAAAGGTVRTIVYHLQVPDDADYAFFEMASALQTG